MFENLIDSIFVSPFTISIVVYTLNQTNGNIKKSSKWKMGKLISGAIILTGAILSIGKYIVAAIIANGQNSSTRTFTYFFQQLVFLLDPG